MRVPFRELARVTTRGTVGVQGDGLWVDGSGVGFSLPVFLTQTPGRIQKVDPLRGSYKVHFSS